MRCVYTRVLPDFRYGPYVADLRLFLRFGYVYSSHRLIYVSRILRSAPFTFILPTVVTCFAVDLLRICCYTTHVVLLGVTWDTTFIPFAIYHVRVPPSFDFGYTFLFPFSGTFHTVCSPPHLLPPYTASGTTLPFVRCSFDLRSCVRVHCDFTVATLHCVTHCFLRALLPFFTLVRCSTRYDFVARCCSPPPILRYDLRSSHSGYVAVLSPPRLVRSYVGRWYSLLPICC